MEVRYNEFTEILNDTRQKSGNYIQQKKLCIKPYCVRKPLEHMLNLKEGSPVWERMLDNLDIAIGIVFD